MRIAIFVSIIFVMFSRLNAQSYTGYMGKKNLLNVNFNLGLANQPQNNSGIGFTFIYPITKIESELERCINADNSIGISCRYMRSLYNSSYFETLVEEIPDVNSSDKYIGTSRINQLTFGVYLKKFISKKGGFSPTGKYIQYGINYHSFSIGESNMYYVTDPDVSNSSLYKIISLEKGSYTSFYFGFGDHKIIKLADKKFFINTSIGTNISSINFTILGSIGSSIYGNKDPFPLYKRYLSQIDFVAAKIGIGYLF